MIELGPLKHLASNIFETAHQEYKKMAYNSKNRVNLLHTFGLRKQIKLANTLCNFDELVIPTVETSPTKLISDTTQYEKYNFTCRDSINEFSYIKWNDKIFKIDSIVEVPVDEETPKFGKIKKLFFYRNDYFISVQIINN